MKKINAARALFGAWAVLAVLLALAVIVLERKPVLAMAKGVLAYWLFILSWVPINVYCLFKPNLEWKAIRHTRSVRLTQMRQPR